MTAALLRDRRALAATAGGMVAMWLWIVALSGLPLLHHQIHEDADHPEHSCAVVAVLAGACDDGVAPVLGAAPDLIPVLDEVAVERPRFDISFRCSGILEHAPPRRS